MHFKLYLQGGGNATEVKLHVYTSYSHAFVNKKQRSLYGSGQAKEVVAIGGLLYIRLRVGISTS